MILKTGDHNTKVALWQGFLNTLGYRLTADSHFGPATERATRSFQTANALKADGVVGEDTIAAAKAKRFAGFPSSNEIEKEAQSKPAASSPLDRVHPTLAARASKLIELAKADGFTLRVVQGLRTIAEQDALYSQGRTRKGPKVTNAKGGQSNHNYGLAVDFAFVVGGEISWDEKLYKNLGRWAKQVDLAWGGNWKSVDLPHVELPGIPKWSELLRLHQTGGMGAVWKMF